MDNQKIKKLLSEIKLSAPKILVVGDIMLDQYVKGNVTRISPEAPVPILDFEKEKNVLGGAGNVIQNLVNLGLKVKLATIIGDDTYGKTIKLLLKKNKVLIDHLYTSPNINTTRKIRYVSKSTQLMRLDFDSRGFKEKDSFLIENKLEEIFYDIDCVIISDYDKGVCTLRLIKKIISKANKLKLPVFIDPKSSNWEKYKNATCITPNKKETESELGTYLNSDLDFEMASKKILEKYNLNSCLITRGSQGMTYTDGENSINQKVGKKEVFDVSGAGDTVISLLAASLSSGLKLKDALELSSYISSEVVTYLGTTAFKPEMINKNG